MAKIRGFKPDLWTDEDFVELSPYARLLWLGMWNFACDNGHLADKPKQIKMRVLPTDDVNCTELLREITDRGLLERGDGWLTVPNLTRHQRPDRRYFTTCEKAGCEAPAETVSQRESRRVHAVQPTGTRSAHDVRTPSAHVDGDGDGDGDGERKVRDDVAQVCALLADLIEGNGSKRPTIGKGWTDAARLMIDRDKRTVEDIEAVIRFAQSNDFWKPNVLSMPKLREKFDMLRLQAERDKPRSAEGWWS